MLKTKSGADIWKKKRKRGGGSDHMEVGNYHLNYTGKSLLYWMHHKDSIASQTQQA